MSFQYRYFSKKFLALGWHRVPFRGHVHVVYHSALQHWCEERIEFKDWVYILNDSDLLESEYWFKHEQDAVMFALRWYNG